jgi:hypothetical protein
MSQRIRPIDLPESLLQRVAHLMRHYPADFAIDSVIDPSNVGTDLAADFIIRRMWLFPGLDSFIGVDGWDDSCAIVWSSTAGVSSDLD